GTKTTFSQILNLGTSGNSIRWGATSAVDTYGNTVTYSWACPASECYPDSVSYNGYSVTFYREARPDPISFALGYALGTTQDRLKTVVVRLGASPIRGYQLSYTASPVTGRSLVASVQQYGKDLVVTSGSITSGTSLPAHTFTYQDDALSHGHAFQAASS